MLQKVFCVAGYVISVALQDIAYQLQKPHLTPNKELVAKNPRNSRMHASFSPTQCCNIVKATLSETERIFHTLH